MPATTDLYFTPEDCAAEAALIPYAQYRAIDSIWGHRAGNPYQNPDDAAAEITFFLLSVFGTRSLPSYSEVYTILVLRCGQLILKKRPSFGLNNIVGQFLLTTPGQNLLQATVVDRHSYDRERKSKATALAP